MLLAGLLLLAGVAEAVEVNSAQGLANAKGFKGNVTLSGNTVTLIKDIELSETITITGGDIVLNLGGKTLKNKRGLISGNIVVLEITNETIITITNGKIDDDRKESLSIKGGTVTLKGAVEISASYTAVNLQSGCLIMDGGSIIAENVVAESVGVLVSSSSKFYMNGGNISASSTLGNVADATGIKIDGGNGNVQLKGGRISASANYNKERSIRSSTQNFEQICVRGYGIYQNNSLCNGSLKEVKGDVEIKLAIYNINYFEKVGSAAPDSINNSTLPSTYTNTIESPQRIEIPNLPDKGHYKFKGWRLTSLDEGTPTPNYILVPNDYKRDVSLTAIFEPKPYKIEYERNGGTNVSGNPDTYTVETELELGGPTRADYIFRGWFTDANFTKPFSKFEKQYYGDPLTLYAKWEAVQYPVTLYHEKTKYEMWGDLFRSVETGLDLSSYLPVRDGYIFLGWKEENGSEILNSIPKGSGEVKLYAQWKPVSFVIKYHTNGGTVLPDEQYNKDTKDDSKWKTGDHVKKDGYVFRGWYLNPEFSENPLTGFPLDVNLGTPSADKSVITINFYAKWEPREYSIVFQNAGDNFIDNKQYNIEQGIEKKDMPIPTWIGRNFLGWFDEDGKLVEFVSPGTGELTLSAKWEYVKYKITYETNGGKVSGETLEYTINDHVKLVTPVKEHYDFSGWYTQPTGGEKYMQDEFSNQTGDKIVYAHWSPKIYQLSFVTNGGSEIEESFSFTYGEKIDVDKRTYRPAYTFKGWFHDNGSFTKPFNKETDGGIGGDLVVYAKWEATRYKIKYDMFHGDPIPDDSYTTEEEKMLPTNAIRDGFSFAGWYADAMLTTGPVTKIEKGSLGDKTFYATWKRGNFIHFLTPENGTIKVVRRGKELVSGDMVGTDVELEISAIPTSEKYRLKNLTIGDKICTSSPQTIKMPANDVYISAIFEDARTVASAPEIITDPENTDNMMTGTTVKVTLKKTDENTTLYYSISDGPKRLYEGPFEVSSETAKLVTLKAFAVKEGCKDGVTVRDMGFGVQKLLVTFDLPAGITAVNPLGGEVVSAIASGGAFEFSLEVDKNYFQSLDSMTVLANDSVLTANANGVYRVEGASKDVKITVKGLENVTYVVTLTQPTKGGHIHFTEDGSDGPLTLPCSKRISVTAVPDLNYKFGGWKNGSQANPGIFTITSDTTLEAVFVPDAKYFTITLPVLEGMTVKPLSNYSTEVLQGEKFHFYLRFAEGYHGENPVVKANGVELTANEEGVYSLYRIAQNYSISVEGVVKDGVKLKLAEHVSAVDIATAADAMKARLYPESMISLLATAPDGQYFVKWNDGNSDNPRVMTVREASGTLPLFQPIPEGGGKKDYANIQLPNVVGAGVSVQVNVHTVEVGSKMPFKVVLLPGYSQSEVKVTANGKPLEESLAMRAASKSRTLVYSLANVEKEVKIEISGLKLDTYNVGVEQSEGGKVSVSPSGRVECGKQVVFTATPDAGNMFVKWSDGNTLNPYPFSVNGDMNLKAVFMRSDMAVANEEIIPSVARIYVRSGKLYVETEASGLYIWNMEGRLIKKVFVPDGCSVYSLPTGFYLVRIGDGKPIKIVIR